MTDYIWTVIRNSVLAAINPIAGEVIELAHYANTPVAHSGDRFVVVLCDRVLELWVKSTRALMLRVVIETRVFRPVMNVTAAHVIIGCMSGLMHIYDIESLRLEKTIKAHDSYLCAIESNATTLLTASSDGQIKLWKVNAIDAPIREFKYRNSSVTTATWDASGTFLFVGASDGTLSIWDTLMFSRFAKRRVCATSVKYLAIHENCILASTWDGCVTRVHCTGMVLNRFQVPCMMARLVIAADNRVYAGSYNHAFHELNVTCGSIARSVSMPDMIISLI